MKKLLLLSIIFALFISGCTSSGAFLSANQTIVNLNEGNYSLKAMNISGESEAAYVLGVSYSSGLIANTIAIGRVEGTGMLYAEALEDLWNNYEQANGSVENQKLALANVRYDTDIWNFLIYTKVKLMIRADIVEFE